MNDAVADTGKQSFAADVVAEPVMNGCHRASLIRGSDRLVDEFLTFAVGDFNARRRVAAFANAFDLAVSAGGERAILGRLIDRELAARRAGIDDEDRFAHGDSAGELADFGRGDTAGMGVECGYGAARHAGTHIVRANS